jgi:hypothetical protein
MQLFNRDNHGGEELVAAIGVISKDITFEKWAPALPLGTRNLAAIVGRDVVNELDGLYRKSEPSVEELQAVALAQQSVAMFTWLKILAPLDAQHGNAGRGKTLGENQHGMTALQEWEDKESIRAMAYEATDALIEVLDTNEWPWWTGSVKCRQRAGLLLPSKEVFDEYYMIGSHRLFLTLLPIIAEVQAGDIAPIVTSAHMDQLMSGDGLEDDVRLRLLELARRPLALLTMKKAVERLPVEVLPEGIVQVQQQATVKQKLKAEKSAREAVAASLGADAERYLQLLQDAVSALDSDEGEVDYYLSGPTIQSKGITY